MLVGAIEPTAEAQFRAARRTHASVQHDIEPDRPCWIVTGRHDQPVRLRRAVHLGDEAADAGARSRDPRMPARFEGFRPLPRPSQGLSHAVTHRTVYCQGQLTPAAFGRDHHPRCFTIWMAGGGVKGGHVHGETDDFSYNVTKDPVHVHDLNSTILHLLGIDHTRLTYKFQGRHFRLTDVHGTVVRDLLAS